MDSRSTNPVEVLVQVMERLRGGSIPGLTKSNCFICDSPQPKLFPPASPIVTICLGDAPLDEALFDGGGLDQLTWHRPILVTPMVRCDLDSVPKSEEALLNEMRGLMPWRSKIISCLLRNNACPDDPRSWWMAIQGEHLLRGGTLVLRHETSPRYLERVGEGHDWLALTLTFHAEFDEELPIL